jgi:PilZ domain
MISAMQSHLGAVLDELLNELDRHAEQAETELSAGKQTQYWLCQRQGTRHRFRCNCLVRFFASAAREIGALPGRTRNLSRRGVGLLVRRPFTDGEVIEMELGKRPSQAPTFLAGEVRFCRYAGRGYYEVGVALKSAQNEAIFSGNPAAAMQTLEWVRKAKFPEQ